MRKSKLATITIIMAFLVVIMGVTTYTAYAETAKVQQNEVFTYRIDANNKVSIKGLVEPVEGLLEIPEKIDGMPVIAIDQYAFADQDAITGVSFPKSLISIENHAFEGCSNIKEVVIPGNVKKIGSSAFRYCTSMGNLTLENGITTIDSAAFADCYMLDVITLPPSVKNISANIFDRCSIREAYLTNVIPAFTDHQTLEVVKVKGEATLIPNMAFSGCTNLTMVELPSTIRNIGYDAFKDCSSLAELDIPDGVTYIGKDAFMRCKLLDNIVIPDGVKALEQYTFTRCYNLKNVTLPEGLTSIGFRAFSECISLESIVIPSTVVDMGEDVFADCTNLKEVHRTPVVTLVSDSYLYTGKVIVPEMTVIDFDGKVPVQGQDYNVTYSGACKNVGSYTMTVTFIGAYKGTVKKTFTIKPVHISKVKLYGLKDKIYTGKKQVQNITGKYNGVEIPLKITYSANRTDIGTRWVKIESSGKNVRGWVKKSYKILPAKSTVKNLTGGKKMITETHKIVGGGCGEYQVAYKLKGAAKWSCKNVIGAKGKIKDLKSGKYYNVKVRAYKLVGGTKYYGAWSDVKTVRTK